MSVGFERVIESRTKESKKAGGKRVMQQFPTTFIYFRELSQDREMIAPCLSLLRSPLLKSHFVLVTLGSY